MSKLTSEKKQRLLEVLRSGASVTSAARAIGMVRQSLYTARAKDEAFAGAWDDAVEEGTDVLEDEAITRAKSSSDTLLIFMLKARRPEKFKDRQSHELTGTEGKDLKFNVNLISPKER